MLPTHALAGMALSLPVALAVPEFAGIVVVAGLFGGVLPDLDMYAGHRKRLHYPTYYSGLAVVAMVVAFGFPTVATLALACFLAAAALHSVADVLGGGLELRPWRATSDRAVYDHYRGRWIAPRRWVAYDGSVGDLALSLVLAVPLLFALGGTLRWIVVAAVTVAVVYTALRRYLATVVEVLVGDVLAHRLPERLLTRLPARYLSR